MLEQGRCARGSSNCFCGTDTVVGLVAIALSILAINAYYANTKTTQAVASAWLTPRTVSRLELPKRFFDFHERRVMNLWVARFIFLERGLRLSTCPWRIDKIMRRLESGITLDSAAATRMNRNLLGM